jgi:hypothetical protein
MNLFNFRSALSEVCLSKRLDSKVIMAVPAKSLLDTVIGEEDPCKLGSEGDFSYEALTWLLRFPLWCDSRLGPYWAT